MLTGMPLALLKKFVLFSLHVQVLIFVSSFSFCTQQDDPFLDSKRSRLVERLKAIDSKLKEVMQNALQVEEQIYQQFMFCLYKLQFEANAKVCQL
jgi:hypothetical protein